MKLHQIRNATLIVTFGGKRFLVDPYLAEKDAYPGFEGTLNSEIRNPRVDLSTPMETILDYDALILTHLHPDHFDEAAIKLLPRDKPVFVQDYSDAELIKALGFTDVRPLGIETKFGDVTLSRTRGQHGSDQAYVYASELLGSVMGVVFRAEGEKTLYLAGDTIWNQMVATNLEMFKPDVIVVAAGDAQVPGLGSIIMGTADVKTIHDAAPTAQIVASHMETINHCALSRAELKAFSEANGMTERLSIPADDAVLEF
ncbi:MAG: MBL fold metallo-hydrolase [Mameliella sp.]|nr:MBL fold metallo-hydrolase [Mameliella sp.]